MKLLVRTEIKNDFKKVIDAFDEDLFLALNPPFPFVTLTTFDGCKEGDKVSLVLDFVLFKQTWTSVIVSDDLSDDGFVFVDEGVELPFFLESWRHEHGIMSKEDGVTVVSDNIAFTTPWWIPAWLMFPAMYFQFKYRQPIYKKKLSG